MRHAIQSRIVALMLMLMLLCLDIGAVLPVAAAAAADDSGSPANLGDAEAEAGAGASQDKTSASASASAKDGDTDSFNAKDHTDWGSYYDPKNIFCGLYDCYQILGFDYENYGRDKPSTKVITKRYRALSREWHPDKSKHKDAKERFVVRAQFMILGTPSIHSYYIAIFIAILTLIILSYPSCSPFAENRQGLRSFD